MECIVQELGVEFNSAECTFCGCSFMAEILPIRRKTLSNQSINLKKTLMK